MWSYICWNRTIKSCKMHHKQRICLIIVFAINYSTAVKSPPQRCFHRHSQINSQILFTRTVRSQRTLISCRIHSDTTDRMQNNGSQCTQQHPATSSKTLLCFFFLHFFFSHIVVLFSMGPCCLKGSVNEFQTISGIEIYWQNSDEPACLPARLRGSHCPECSEHMLLSCAACLTAKGWFNYINCLMTEERAAGPCMLVCDKRETLLRHGPSLCKSDSNLENLGNCTQYKAYVSCFF